LSILLLSSTQLNLPKERANKLKCRYISYHPALKIAPVKEELMYDDPPIWLYHDVISESQIQIMKSLALPNVKNQLHSQNAQFLEKIYFIYILNKLKRAMVGQGRHGQYSEMRISKRF
jgi:hypothetical protein